MTRSDRFALATLLFLLAQSAVMQVLMASEGDKNWLLLAAKLWIGGQKLYVDIVEVNPPLILWLYGLAGSVSQHLVHLRDFEALGLMGLLLSAASVWLCTRLIRLHPAFASDARKQVEFALLLAAIFIFLTPQDFFFDREHILLVATFPYILRFMPALWTQRPSLVLRLSVGLVAALGFCIKPHSIILFAAVQLLFIRREHSFSILWSIENIIILLAGAAYLLCIWHFTPEYVNVILPMALETYSAFNRSGSSLLTLPPALFCLGLTFADFRPRHVTPYRRDIYYFLGIALAFLLHAVVSNGWDYTYYPMMSTLLFLSGWVMWEYLWLKQTHEAQGLPTRTFVYGMRGCGVSLASQGVYMAVMTMLSMSVFAIQTRCARTPECLLQDPYVRYVHDHNIHTFGTITLDYPKWVMLMRRSGAQWETRFNHLWMLPGLLKDDKAAAAQHAWIARYVTDALADDFTRRKPDVVFVDTGRQFFAYPRYIDLLGFLSQSPAFATAWTHYHYTSTIDECKDTDRLYYKAACRYDVYSRN